MALFTWIKRHPFESLLALILCVLCLCNYTPNTFLTGWDNLMPELNIWMNLKRSFFAVWQQYQGLGLVGGMAHATDLIRQLIILPFTLILPVNLIRYLWHFAMLFLGSFGIFYLLKKNKFSPLISFTSALFYLLNFGSIQYFWVAFEPFSTFWGFFPWLIHYLLNYLHSPIKPNLKKLILINILAIPSFYVQTIFIVYILCVSLIILANFITSDKKILSLKQSTYIFFLLFLINSFWLLPQLYFLKNNLQNPVTGIGNYMSNEETFSRNQLRGNISDFLLLRGYYYDFTNNGQTLMAPWHLHFSNGYYLYFSYLISTFILLGLIFNIFRIKKNTLFLSITFLFFLSCLALLSNVTFFKELNNIIRNFPIINQIFRSPWTKFLVPASFTFSLLLAFGLEKISALLSQTKYSSFICKLPILFVVSFIFLSSFPVFKGNYFSPDIRQKIPDEYFEIFNYFKIQNHTGRIANLPQGSFWGWTNYKWGVSGSGFLWYSLENPIMDRAFDAWNLKNEQYYWELNNAIQSKDSILLENVISKYSIEYIIFDNNVYYPDDKIYAKLTRPTKELLDSIPNFKLIRNTKNIFVYETSSPNRVYLSSNLPNASSFDFSLIDKNYQKFGDYITTKNSSNTFTNLFTNRLQTEITFNPLSFSLTENDPANINPTHSDTNQPTFAYNFPKATLSKNYLVKIVSQHFSGLPLKISAVSDNSQNKYFQTILPVSPNPATSWFYIPSRQSDDFDFGLNFIFDNTSFSLPNKNIINQITLYSLPPNQENLSPSLSREYLFSNSNIFYSKVYPIHSASTLIFPEAYDSGWIAINFDHSKIKILDHYQVNNWANAWNIEGIKNDNIYIIFWPQFLEFFGFILLLWPLFLLLKPRNPSPHSP